MSLADHPLETIAARAVEGVMAQARNQGAALQAVLRLAAVAYAQLEGHDATCGELARLARRHAERAVRVRA